MDREKIPASVLELAAALARQLREQLSRKYQARFDPEDIIQSVFRSLYEERNREVREAGEDAFRAAVYVHTQNRLLNYLRNHGRAKRSPDREQRISHQENGMTGDETEPIDVPDGGAADPAELAEAREIVEQIRGWVTAAVRERHRDHPEYAQIVGLLEQGYGNREIADRVKCGLRTVVRLRQEIRELGQVLMST
jgi:DNA-directed RNA polymerase specialized sigma24 family protein